MSYQAERCTYWWTRLGVLIGDAYHRCQTTEMVPSGDSALHRWFARDVPSGDATTVVHSRCLHRSARLPQWLRTRCPIRRRATTGGRSALNVPSGDAHPPPQAPSRDPCIFTLVYLITVAGFAYSVRGSGLYLEPKRAPHIILFDVYCRCLNVEIYGIG
ncbi:hypothetical protein AVEN_79906-1 [Araneus ventricosus]|uniref:Uncharacterized protein n=1 Tax=Araneus ventricosus TaxID=182803 RepID=A0A4Y2DT30_ARAVE|nr:hypothetical protein AVEN_79906-1 [Araneus ventricosus]